jgi:hypothetical protein
MRVLFRITLTLLIALPIVLGLAVFFALQVLQGAAPAPAPAPEGEETLPSERVGLGQERTAT